MLFARRIDHITYFTIATGLRELNTIL